MTIPDSNLSWENSFDYVFDSLALFDNDKDQGEPVDIRDLFVQKVSDVAKVESKLYHIGGNLFDVRLEWQEPINDQRVPGLESLIEWLNERAPGSGPTYNVRRTYYLQNPGNEPLPEPTRAEGARAGESAR